MGSYELSRFLTLKQSQNHRMLWVGKELKDHFVANPCHGQRHFHQGCPKPCPSWPGTPPEKTNTEKGNKNKQKKEDISHKYLPYSVLTELSFHNKRGMGEDNKSYFCIAFYAHTFKNLKTLL